MLNINKFINKLKENLNLIFIVLLCFIPIIWFYGRGEVLITGLDTNFPLDPVLWIVRRFYVWNGINNAGIDFSSSTAGLFFHFIQVIPSVLGLTLKYVEIFSMIFWFSAIVLSSYSLSRVVTPNNKISQLIIVIIYSLNTYLFNTWENVKVSNLALVAVLPLFISIIYSWKNNLISNKKALIYLALASILSTGAGINPAYFAVIILTIVILSLILKSFKIGLISILILIGINTFWIIPLANFLLSFQNGVISDLGYTNWLQSLSENNSIINVARLQGAWDWYALNPSGLPQYLPYAVNYLYNLPFVVFSFAVPLISLLSFIFRSEKKEAWYLYFGILTILGIFFGAGSHTPTGTIYLFLATHLPFFSFFRSPWYIFTPILIVSYACLSGLLYERLSELLSKTRIYILLKILGIGFLICYGLYNYPLITGKIFRPDSDGFYIKFPSYVDDAKEYLNSGSSNSRIISYPDDQLESFKWGYKGTESILSLFSNKETITPSFNISSRTLSEMLNLFYGQIKRKEYFSAISLMNLLGADEIFYKKDVSTLSPKIGDEIKQYVDVKTIGEWVFMKVKRPIDGKLFLASSIYNNLNNPEDFVYLSSILNSKTVIVDHSDTEVEKTGLLSPAPIILKTDNLGEQSDELNNIQKYRFTIFEEGMYSFVVEKQFLRKDQIIVNIDDTNISSDTFNENDSLITIGPKNLDKGVHILTVTYPEAKNLFDVGDFSSYAKDLNLKKNELPEDVRKTLVAYNPTNKSKTISLKLNNFDPFYRYAIEFDYKYVYGSVPIVDSLQSTMSSPVKTETIYPGSSQDWDHIYKIFEPIETDSKYELWIKLPANKLGDKSKAYFENISVHRIYDNKVFVIEERSEETGLSQGELTYNKISPVKYEIKINHTDTPTSDLVLVFLDNYSKDWQLKVKDSKNNKITPIHFKVNGYANAWFIPSTDDLTIALYYKPENLFLIGGLISILTIGIVLTLKK